jgi:hypothetical protein
MKISMKKFIDRYFNLILASFLIIGAVALRLLPHPANFAPITAIGLFSGFYLRRSWIWLIPIATLLISDFFIGFYHWPIMISVYGSFGVIALIGYYLRRRRTIFTVIGSSLIASLLFFIITNLAVWRFSEMYQLTSQELLNCFWLALPFFRNTLAGDLCYITILFGGWELAHRFLKTKPKNSQLCTHPVQTIDRIEKRE